MRTTISAPNPHGYDRYGFAWENVPAGTHAHLDFGCYDGEFLNTLRSRNIHRLVGADISRTATKDAEQKFPDLEFLSLTQTVPLPFPDRTFDSITMLDVLEHVHEQVDLLKELHRILADEGVLIVTVPGLYFFSFLDMGNLKFLFPRLHRRYYCRSHSPEEYERRYLNNPDGLVGDVSAKKSWHEHFSKTKIKTLMDRAGLDVVKFDGSGFITRPVNVAGFLLRRFGRIRPFIQRLRRMDARRFESMNLFCAVRKKYA